MRDCVGFSQIQSHLIENLNFDGVTIDIKEHSNIHNV